MRRKVQAKATDEQERSGDVGEINGVFSVVILWENRYYKTDGSQNGPIDKGKFEPTHRRKPTTEWLENFKKIQGVMTCVRNSYGE